MRGVEPGQLLGARVVADRGGAAAFGQDGGFGVPVQVELDPLPRAIDAVRIRTGVEEQPCDLYLAIASRDQKRRQT